ncbi:MAG TPA: tRNA (adenosine(37)-N6)-threonylcarbamoyltransferase complex dimerization subunit type 1 TsaB [Candidatus Binatia bacterium]|nr:tRNA (adenosine(37)-N6)-threonylcarbamoyltransferase complex dimerization subunit type 1 TsaB [Candidatus Binatia bacterium]
MFVLAIDTSGKHGSVALCHGDAASFAVLGLSAIEGGTYSARLMPCIADLLQQAGLSKTQLDGIVVVDGPGSFTGLRVGLSTVKGLCEVLQKPLAVVSMLEALALTYGRDGDTVISVLDAGRGEVYVGEYEVRGGRAELREQSIVKLDEFVKQLPQLKNRVFSPFSKISAQGKAMVTQTEPLQADAVGRIGLKKLLAGNTVDPATLDANYIRRSDAELFSLPKR